MILSLAGMSLALAAASTSRAQAPPQVDLLDAKRLAKATYEAERARPRDLAIERVQAAHEAWSSCWQERPVLTETLDTPCDPGRHLRDAEAAVAETPGERAAAFERQWTRDQLREMIVTAKYQAARVGRLDLRTARAARLESEIAWSASHAGRPANATLTSATSLVLFGSEFPPERSKAIAKAKFEAFQGNPHRAGTAETRSSAGSLAR